MTVRRNPVRDHEGVIPETIDPSGDRIPLMFSPHAVPTTRQNDHCPARCLCPVMAKQEWGEMDGIGTVRGLFGSIGPDGNRG
jgi:hypothetical protein